MTLQEVKTSLQFILDDANGSVVFPVKYEIAEWIYDLEVFKDGEGEFAAGYCVLPSLKKYETINDLMVFVMNSIFTKKNMALAIRGLAAHGMIDRDIDDYSDSELSALVKEYNAKFFDTDYPFVKEAECSASNAK